MDYRVNCRHLLTIYISLLKRPNQNRFAQTAGIGVRRAFAPCAEDIASAHPPAMHKLCGVINVGRHKQRVSLGDGEVFAALEPNEGVVELEWDLELL